MNSEEICLYQNAYNVQVLKYDKLVQVSFNRIDTIRKLLKTKLLTIETRERLEREIEEIQRMLEINKKQLDRLRKEDRRSFIIIVCLIFICFLIYGVYCIFINNEKSTAFINTT